jgi:hypothetical protein
LKDATEIVDIVVEDLAILADCWARKSGGGRQVVGRMEGAVPQLKMDVIEKCEKVRIHCIIITCAEIGVWFGKVAKLKHAACSLQLSYSGVAETRLHQHPAEASEASCDGKERKFTVAE